MSVSSRDFTRAVYNEVILPNIPNLKSLDTKKYICDLSYHDKSNNHPHCFWYCVDVCWSRGNDDKNPSVSKVVCLFQCFFSHLNEILPMNKSELNTLQDKTRTDIIQYLKQNIPDAEEQIAQYNKTYKIDLMSGVDDWWVTFC